MNLFLHFPPCSFPLVTALVTGGRVTPRGSDQLRATAVAGLCETLNLPSAARRLKEAPPGVESHGARRLKRASAEQAAIEMMGRCGEQAKEICPKRWRRMADVPEGRGLWIRTSTARPQGYPGDLRGTFGPTARGSLFFWGLPDLQDLQFTSNHPATFHQTHRSPLASK